MKFNTDGLLEPQHKHAGILARSLDTNRISFDATVMGGGKTFTASSIARHFKDKKIFVIAPKKVFAGWKNTLAQFGVTPKGIINLDTLVRGKTKWMKYRRATKEENAEGIDKMMLAVLKIPKDWIVFLDEAHRCKGVTSLSAGVLMALKRQDYQFHLMSATMATSPLDMRAFGYALGLHSGTMKEYKKFCINAGAEWTGHHGSMTFDSECPIAQQKMKDVHHFIYNHREIGSRLTRQDFKGIFPDNQIIAESYDMGENGTKIQDAYDDMMMELAALEKMSANYSQHIFAVMIAARRKIEMLKVPTIVELILDSYEGGRSPIAFMNFTDSIEAVYARLIKNVDEKLIGRIYGERSDKEQAEDLAGFQSDDKRIQLANLASGGECINMHDLHGRYGREQIINPSWNALKVLQAVGRADRAHAKTDVITRFLFADGTCEVPICQRFQARKNNLDTLNSGHLMPDEQIFKLGSAGLNI